MLTTRKFEPEGFFNNRVVGSNPFKAVIMT